MKTFYSTTLEVNNITQEKYDMLIDFLEANNISYNENDFEEYTIDERTDDEKYDDWLWTLADNKKEE